MVDIKRVERKIPLLITDGPWFSGELDRNESRIRKFKQQAPDRYIARRNNIINELAALRHDVDEFMQNNSRKGNRGRRPIF